MKLTDRRPHALSLALVTIVAIALYDLSCHRGEPTAETFRADNIVATTSIQLNATLGAS